MYADEVQGSPEGSLSCHVTRISSLISCHKLNCKLHGHLRYGHKKKKKKKKKAPRSLSHCNAVHNDHDVIDKQKKDDHTGLGTHTPLVMQTSKNIVQ